MSDSRSNRHDEKPPVFRSWGGWYTLVIGVLVLQIVLYLWLTRAFA